MMICPLEWLKYVINQFKPLILLFGNLTKSAYYPDIWKKSNKIPVHKKNDKQLVDSL